ncbi:MAG: ABC transporter substrate-binding protein [Candidatus Hermodarchaeota archaeon]
MNHQKKFAFIFIFFMVASLGLVGWRPGFAQVPLFKAILMEHVNNPVRVQHALMVANELPKIGIGATLILIGMDIFFPRMFESPNHADWNHGGFDFGFWACSDSIVPSNLYKFFHSSNESPQGANYYPVINQTLDGILEYVMNTTDFTERKAYIKQALEMIVWEIHPVTGMYQHETMCYMRDNVRGYSNNLRVPGALGIAEMYFEDGRSHGHGRQNEFIMASTTRPSQYNDIIENNWYNQLAIAPVNHGLVERDPNYDFIPVLLTQLPYPVAVKNNHTGLESSLDPNLATVWEIELRNDVYWHEGYGYTMVDHEDTLKVDADDVLFTFDLILNDNGPNPCAVRPSWQHLLGNDTSLAVIKVDRFQVQFHLQTIHADLLAYFGQYLMPQHILALGTIRADGSVAPADFTNWVTDDWNLGRRTGGYTGSAVIGNGPYICYPGEDYASQTVNETRNPHWHLRNEPAYQNMFDKYIYRWITSKDATYIALEQKEIDFVDYTFFKFAYKDYPVMKNKTGIKTVRELDWGYQTLGYNILHGAGDKLANKWVRLAIAHMIPYQDIVKYFLGGLGQANFAPFPKQSPFWPTDLRPIEYNQTKALDYLEKAGYNVTPFREETRTSSYSLFDLFLSDPLIWMLLTTCGLEVIVIGFLVMLIKRKQKGIS